MLSRALNHMQCDRYPANKWCSSPRDSALTGLSLDEAQIHDILHEYDADGSGTKRDAKVVLTGVFRENRDGGVCATRAGRS